MMVAGLGVHQNNGNPLRAALYTPERRVVKLTRLTTDNNRARARIRMLLYLYVLAWLSYYS